MNTRPALIALSLTVSLATLAHANVPEVRIGDTVEQINRRQWQLFTADPVPVFPYVNASSRDWRVYPGFYRGRADSVSYTKDRAFIPQAEVEELLKLNGGGRRWRKIDEPVTKGEKTERSRATRWMTEDGLLRASLAGGMELTVCTAGWPYRAADPVKVNREDARRALELGANLGTLVPLFLGADPNAANDKLKLVRRALGGIRAAEAARAADPSIGGRDLPAKKGDGLDLVKILMYQASISDALHNALGKDEVTAGQPAVAGCFDLGLSGALLVFFDSTGDPKWKAHYLDQLSAAGRDSNLPKDLWQPLVEKARAGSPTEAVRAAFVRMYDGCNTFLDAKPTRSKPASRPGRGAPPNVAAPKARPAADRAAIMDWRHFGGLVGNWKLKAGTSPRDESGVMRIAKDRTFFWRHESGRGRNRVEVGGKIDFMAFDEKQGVGSFRFQGITSADLDNDFDQKDVVGSLKYRVRGGQVVMIGDLNVPGTQGQYERQ